MPYFFKCFLGVLWLFVKKLIRTSGTIQWLLALSYDFSLRCITRSHRTKIYLGSTAMPPYNPFCFRSSQFIIKFWFRSAQTILNKLYIIWINIYFLWIILQAILFSWPKQSTWIFRTFLYQKKKYISWYFTKPIDRKFNW